jgi:hypothetical protein
VDININNITASLEKLDHLADVPAPVLFNTWKHHAGAMRQRLRALAQEGPKALVTLPRQLQVIGTELMDLYVGALAPKQIAAKVSAMLQATSTLELDRYKAWLTASGSYSVLTFPEDDTRWVLRLGDESNRYVHVHPVRWSPQTRRVRANVLKTALMVQAHVAVHGGDPYDVARINVVRKEFLGLSPVQRLSGAEGLSVVLKELDVTA